MSDVTLLNNIPSCLDNVLPYLSNWVQNSGLQKGKNPTTTWPVHIWATSSLGQIYTLSTPGSSGSPASLFRSTYAPQEHDSSSLLNHFYSSRKMRENKWTTTTKTHNKKLFYAFSFLSSAVRVVSLSPPRRDEVLIVVSIIQSRDQVNLCYSVKMGTFLEFLS